MGRAIVRAETRPASRRRGARRGELDMALESLRAETKRLLDRPLPVTLAVVALLALTALGVSYFPRSIMIFMLFQASILLLYLARLPAWLKGLLAAGTLGILMPVLGSVNGYYLEIAIQVGIFVALALGLNIVVGLAGLLDLGYVAYLAVVTLGFGEVIRVLANNLDKPINFTNGPKGITPIARPPIFFAPLLRALGIDPNPNVIYPLYLYFLVLAIVGVTILVNRRLEDSHIGRAWEAIREDQTAAQAMGVPLVRMKLMAFACGASFAGAVGVLFSAKQIFINPESFTFMESIGVLAMIILGGMGSIPGAVLGATVVTVLNLQ